MHLQINALQRTERFDKDFSALDQGLKKQTGDCLRLLIQNPRAKSLRTHTLQGGSKPTIYKIDVDTNRSYQVTFILEGATAVLLRVASHKQIDRHPN